VFELRIATVANKEKLKVLTDRFRGGEVKIWERLGMKGVGFWVPTDSPKSENMLIYILAHENRQKADESWEKFRTDPEWLAFTKTPDLGPVTVDRTFMAPVDFSAIR
jgi:NIPSNAP